MSEALANDYLENDFRSKAIQFIAMATLLCITPFAISNVLNGHYAVAWSSVLVIFVFAFNGWQVNRQIDRPWFSMWMLVPVIVAFLVVAFLNQGVIAVFWCYPAILAYYFILEERQAWLANGVTLLFAVYLSWWLLDIDIAIRATASLLAVTMFSVISARTTSDYQEKLKTHIVTDNLTGLLNRSLVKITLSRALEHNRRVGTPMTLLAIDLDYFKLINDSFGHDAGDKVLVDVGRIIKECTRLSDSCFRMGGEEFLCLLYGSDAQNALRIVENMRKAMSASTVIDNYSLTSSFGVATFDGEETWENWCLRVDDNLYRAKSAGRDCAVV